MLYKRSRYQCYTSSKSLTRTSRNEKLANILAYWRDLWTEGAYVKLEGPIIKLRTWSTKSLISHSQCCLEMLWDPDRLTFIHTLTRDPNESQDCRAGQQLKCDLNNCQGYINPHSSEKPISYHERWNMFEILKQVQLPLKSTRLQGHYKCLLMNNICQQLELLIDIFNFILPFIFHNVRRHGSWAGYCFHHCLCWWTWGEYYFVPDNYHVELISRVGVGTKQYTLTE